MFIAMPYRSCPDLFDRELLLIGEMLGPARRAIAVQITLPTAFVVNDGLMVGLNCLEAIDGRR
jgi:hypothetical protein